MQENEQLNPEELQVKALTTIPAEELEVEEKIMEGVEDLLPEDLDKSTYLKVSPTFYIKAVETPEPEEGEEPQELFKILNPVTNEVETRELTDDEKKELFVQQLKQSRRTFNPTSHPTKVVGTTKQEHPILKDKDGNPAIRRVTKDREVQTNVTLNKFGAAYKKKRQTKNKLQKKSRKANR